MKFDTVTEIVRTVP